MKEGLNQVTFAGNLCADPELRHTPRGTAVLSLRVACGYRVERDGEWVNKAEYQSVTLFGGRCEGLSKFLRKGSEVICQGRIQTKEVEKNGEKRYYTEIVAHNVIPCGGGERQKRDTEPAPDGQESFGLDEDDGDIPF